MSYFPIGLFTENKLRLFIHERSQEYKHGEIALVKLF